MNTQEKYNGWKNYETWNVALWFGNEEHLYRNVVSRLERKGKFSAFNAKILVKRNMPYGTPDFEGMGKSRCYSRVDWEEIADCFNEYGE
jgi:hypothetical protein